MPLPMPMTDPLDADPSIPQIPMLQIARSVSAITAKSLDLRDYLGWEWE